MAFSPEIFAEVNKVIEDDIKQELRLQGHYATGELERSMKVEQIFEGGNVSFELIALGYIQELEEGVPASQINVSPVEFQRLVKWVKFRGLASSETKARQVAYFIIQRWKEEGKPLENSRQFSETGEILHAVRNVFQSHKEEKYVSMLNTKIASVFTQDLKIRIKSTII
jgi:hypothetical protein